MEEKIYREKSLENLSSPEELTGYLRVTGPGVWVTLVGIIILLTGMFFWGIFGTIIKTVTVPAEAADGVISCYVLTDDLDLSDKEVTIEIGDMAITAKTENAGTKTMNASDNETLYDSGYLSPGKNVYVLTGKTTLADGFYNADVTTETLRPISLLFSRE